jgi:hypothetical protein
MVEGKRAWRLTELRAHADDVHARLVQALRGLRDDEWLAEVTVDETRTAPLAQALGSTLGAPNHPFGHVAAHLDDLRRVASG